MGSTEPPDVAAALLARAQRAIDAAARINADSEVLVEISSALRSSAMTTRCAWCGRYRISRHWVRVERPPEIAAFGEVSHGICEDCVTALRRTGMSV